MVIQYEEISPLGDCAIVVKLGDKVDLETHTKVRLFSEFISMHPFDGFVEYVPAFASVTVVYDSYEIFRSQYQKTGRRDSISPYTHVVKLLQQMLESIDEVSVPEPQRIEVPVCYGGELGVDLEDVAQLNGLTVDDVIEIHSSQDYLVYMLGFAPGFPYLGGMDKRISAPRRKTPRLEIPAGTVGIAGEQTGVYPIQTPGGWQLIGRTPLALFLPEKSPPTLLEAGNLVRFYPISHQEYERWRMRS